MGESFLLVQHANTLYLCRYFWFAIKLRPKPNAKLVFEVKNSRHHNKNYPLIIFCIVTQDTSCMLSWSCWILIPLYKAATLRTVTLNPHIDSSTLNIPPQVATANLGSDEQIFSFDGSIIDFLFDCHTHFLLITVSPGTVNMTITWTDGTLDCFFYLSWLRLKVK